MDPKEFKRRLEELAEIMPNKVPNHKGRKPDEPIIVHRDGEEIVIPEDENHTLTYRIKKLRNESQKCPDCNKKVKNRIIYTKLYTYPIGHWRRLCNGCNLTEHPESKKFCLLGSGTQHVWNTWLRNNHPNLVKEPDLIPAEKKPAK